MLATTAQASPAESLVSCPACSHTPGVIEAGDKVETCKVCRGEASVSMLTAVEYENDKLLVERLTLTARVTQLTAELQVLSPLYKACREHALKRDDVALGNAIARAEREMQQLDILLGRVARKVA